MGALLHVRKGWKMAADQHLSIHDSGPRWRGGAAGIFRWALGVVFCGLLPIMILRLGAERLERVFVLTMDGFMAILAAMLLFVAWLVIRQLRSESSLARVALWANGGALGAVVIASVLLKGARALFE